MKQIYQHPLLESFSKEQREEIWYTYREKFPNWAWSVTFYSLWFLWTVAWMMLAQCICEYYLERIVGRITIHLIVTLLIGVVGGVILTGKIMMPIRVREFHRYLDRKNENVLRDELEIERL